MYGIAILDSGNIAMNFCRLLEKKGYVFEVVSTPCQIATSGCGYCLRFPMEYLNLVIDEGKANNIYVREIYRVVRLGIKNRYEKVWIN
ncbi:MAG: DUF3343 domain-containing protein [Ruminiclostridium sp.]|nr:DUF3343 domain-containing protein [Ruminiclostridium sp.]